MIGGGMDASIMCQPLAGSARHAGPTGAPSPLTRKGDHAYRSSLASADCRCCATILPRYGSDCCHDLDTLGHDDTHAHGYDNEGPRRPDGKVARLLKAGRLQGFAWKAAQELHVELQKGLTRKLRSQCGLNAHAFLQPSVIDRPRLDCCCFGRVLFCTEIAEAGREFRFFRYGQVIELPDGRGAVRSPQRVRGSDENQVVRRRQVNCSGIPCSARHRPLASITISKRIVVSDGCRYRQSRDHYCMSPTTPCGRA